MAYGRKLLEALLDDEQLLSAAYTLNDQSPLGQPPATAFPSTLTAVCRRSVASQSPE